MGVSLTGHAEIDHQHLILVSMVEELARFCAESVRDPNASCTQCSASVRQRCSKTLASITDELRAFLVGHAIYEERLMELLPRTAKCNAYVESHTAAHHDIAKQLKRITQQIDTECPKLNAAQLERIVRAWIGDHAVMLDTVLVDQLSRHKKSEVDFDGELVVILDKYVFHDRPTRKKPAATLDRDRRQLEILGRFESLSPAQRDVYWLVVNGSKNSEIASRLGISINTVKTHRAAVFHKMEVSSVLELVTKTDVLRETPHK
jgi:hemerythrin-like metal-binding protein